MYRRLKIVIFLSLFGVFSVLYAQEINRVKVLCYNLRFGELATLEELAEFIKSQNPDVVALQEVDVKTSRKWIPHQNGKDFITELGFRTGMLTSYAKTIPFANGYYGIGILSKYPFTETRRVILPMPEGSKEQRAMLLANVELPDGKLFTFICTHLDYPSSEVRQVQVEALTSILKGNPHPMILAGDFNANPESPEISVGMAGWMPVSAPDYTFPSSDPKAKIDYIFCYPDSTWTVVSASTLRVMLSDHLPVSATLQLQFY
ncbi:MAG: endonuclease/exonuclease/phosphatase family protein [Candidatus Neomarinimicrobiota bacterium]